MDISWIMAIFTIGFIGSFVSGMVGIGGSIINYPMLLLIPPILGFAAFSPHEVSAISAVQVFFASLTGMLVYRKGGFLHKTLVLYMGAAIIAGSFAGSYFSKALPGGAINLVYAILALLAALMMLLPKKGSDATAAGDVEFNRPLAVGLALAIGAASGIVGAAGAFITVPVMLTVLKIPTRVAIASSMAITFISSIGSTAGKLMGGHMQFAPAAALVAASLIAAPLGAKLGKNVHTKVLQGVLAALILGTVVKIWYSILI